MPIQGRCPCLDSVAPPGLLWVGCLYQGRCLYRGDAPAYILSPLRGFFGWDAYIRGVAYTGALPLPIFRRPSGASVGGMLIQLKFIKTDASRKRLMALIFRKFSTRKLLAENTRILRGLGKWLAFSRLALKNHKIPFAGWKKSTPKKKLALPFSERACLRKRKSTPKSSKILHKTTTTVQNPP